MIKVEFFRECRKFGYRKWHNPIGKTFNHCQDFQGRIYTTMRLFSSPIGSVRFEVIPKIG